MNLQEIGSLDIESFEDYKAAIQTELDERTGGFEYDLDQFKSIIASGWANDEAAEVIADDIIHAIGSMY